MNADTLRAMMPLARPDRIESFAPALTIAMDEFMIKTPKCQAAFLAQVCHETMSLLYMRELASGADYDTGNKAIALGNTPAADGDGQLYRGRGPFMITGLANYTACGVALKLDLVKHPELLEQPVEGSRSAGWFWWKNSLSGLAESDNFGSLTKAINGGYNGLDDRIKHWLRIRKVMGI